MPLYLLPVGIIIGHFFLSFLPSIYFVPYIMAGNMVKKLQGCQVVLLLLLYPTLWACNGCSSSTVKKEGAELETVEKEMDQEVVGKETAREKSGGRGCISGNCEDGRGVYAYDSGDVYTGEWKAGQRDGKGLFRYANGDRFDGLWQEDLKQGAGVYTFASGEVLSGNFSEGRMQGRGRYRFKDGSLFEGDFQDNETARDGLYSSGNRSRPCELRARSLFCNRP